MNDIFNKFQLNVETTIEIKQKQVSRGRSRQREVVLSRRGGTPSTSWQFYRSQSPTCSTL
jgi:hypothetical protein